MQEPSGPTGGFVDPGGLQAEGTWTSDPALDAGLKDQLLALPSEAYVAECVGQDVDPPRIHRLREQDGVGPMAGQSQFRVIGAATTRSRGVRFGEIAVMNETERAIRTASVGSSAPSRATTPGTVTGSVRGRRSWRGPPNTTSRRATVALARASGTAPLSE